MNSFANFFLTTGFLLTIGRLLAIGLLVVATAVPLFAQSGKRQSRPLVQATQQALDTLARAEIAREEGKRGQPLAALRKEFRSAIAQFHTLEKQQADLLRQAYPLRPSQRGENDWTPLELESLARNLKGQLARAYRNQALCYPAGSADRVNALGQALEQLGEVVTLPLDAASVWQARIEQIVCLRLLKKRTEAEQQIVRWQKASPPQDIVLRLADELRNLELEAGNLTSALAQEDPRLLNYAAASFYTSGKLSEAVATYDRLAALEAAAGHFGRQFQALESAAAIVREMKNHSEALTRFRELALQKPRRDEDANMHLVAIGLAAEWVRDATLEESEQSEERFEFYVTLLNEHLQHWPKGSSAKKVRQWLDRTKRPEIDRLRFQKLANQGNRQQALALYRKRIADAPDDAQLLEAYAQLLATGKDQVELRKALQSWRILEKRSKPGGPRWWRSRRARLALLDSLGEGGQAKKLRQLTEILHPESRE